MHVLNISMEKIMQTSNDITSLQQITVKPLSWLITQANNGEYRLSFTYVAADRNEYAYLQTIRGKTKIYRSEKAILKDIAKVDKEPLIYALFN